MHQRSIFQKMATVQGFLSLSPFSFSTSSWSRLYMADLDYAKDLEKIGRLVGQLESSPVIGSFDTWYHTFVQFVNKRRKAEFGTNLLPDNQNYSEALFQEDITTFLADPDGLTFKNDFEFPRSGNNTNRVLLSSMKFNHVPFDTTAKAITGMKDTFEKIKAISFSGNVFATSEPYTMWIMIDIITEELVRNVSLALLVIFICTFILVMEFATSLLVLLTVGLTIIDTAGFLQFWGLFLDQDFAIFLTISIGLCVDYSAHVAHCFMVTQVRLWTTVITILEVFWRMKALVKGESKDDNGDAGIKGRTDGEDVDSHWTGCLQRRSLHILRLCPSCLLQVPDLPCLLQGLLPRCVLWLVPRSDLPAGGVEPDWTEEPAPRHC